MVLKCPHSNPRISSCSTLPECVYSHNRSHCVLMHSRHRFIYCPGQLGFVYAYFHINLPVLCGCFNVHKSKHEIQPTYPTSISTITQRCLPGYCFYVTKSSQFMNEFIQHIETNSKQKVLTADYFTYFMDLH